jgi:hypothetical protein
MDCFSTYLFAVPIALVYPFFVAILYDKFSSTSTNKFTHMMIISIVGIILAMYLSQKLSENWIPSVVGLFKGSILLALYYLYVNWDVISINTKLLIIGITLALMIYLSFHTNYIVNLYPLKSNMLCQKLDESVMNYVKM